MNEGSPELSTPNTPMVNIALDNICEDLEALFPDKDLSSLMEDLEKDLIQINALLNVLTDEYKVNKRGAIKKWEKGEPIPEPMHRALDDLSETAWDIILVNAGYILGRIKKINIIGWEHINSQQRSNVLSIGLKMAHEVVLNYNPSTGITQGKIFQRLASRLKNHFLMREKVSNSEDWLEIDEKVENIPTSDDGPENAMISTAFAKTLNELIRNDSSGLTPRMKQVLKLMYLDAPGDKLTLEEVAKKMGISIERVRQIKIDALGKLRHPTILRKLKDLELS